MLVGNGIAFQQVGEQTDGVKLTSRVQGAPVTGLFSRWVFDFQRQER